MNSVGIKLLFSFVFTFLVTFYLVPVLCRLAVKLGTVDVPDGKIKLHKGTVPYLGGIAVYCGFISSLALVCPFDCDLIFFIVGITILLFIGLIDDLIILSPLQKFFGQLIVTMCFLKGGIFLKKVFFHNFWNIGLSAFWILLVINAFNLIDVMDGLTAVVAISSSVSFFILACMFRQWVVAFLLISFIGALLGFFVFNRPSAKIYLGDAGSLFIGGFLATIPFYLKWGCYQELGYLGPVIILAVPLLEVATLVVIRSYKRIPFYNGSLDHFSLLLQKKGWAKWSILIYILIISFFKDIVALLFVSGRLRVEAVALFGLAFLFIWFAALLIRPRRTQK